MHASRAAVIAAAGVVLALAGTAIAQTPTKSARIASLAEGEAIMVSPKGNVHKSNTTVSAAKHQAALTKGAKEVSNRTVIYRQGGKMYMFDYQDAANTKAAEDFQSQFDND